jgi:hypothetical protein
MMNPSPYNLRQSWPLQRSLDLRSGVEWTIPASFEPHLRPNVEGNYLDKLLKRREWHWHHQNVEECDV